MEALLSLRPNYATTGIYYCSFLVKYPADKKKTDEFSRWRPDWCRYSRYSITDYIMFGDRILFRPSILLGSSKYIRWSNNINLASEEVVLSGLFNFKSISSTYRTWFKVAGEHWHVLNNICTSKGILPPTIGSTIFIVPTNNRPRIKSQKRKL